MKKLKLSPWRKMSNPPTEVGLYELKQQKYDPLIYSWWDGYFHGAWRSFESAYENREFDDTGWASKATGWRGVLK